MVIRASRFDQAGANQLDGLEVVLDAIHRSADEPEFMILDEAHVDRSQIGEDADNEDIGSLASIIDGLFHSGVDSDAFEDNVGFVWAKGRDDLVQEVFLFGIDDLDATFGGRFQAIGTQFAEQDIGCAHGLGGLSDQVADRTTAQNQNLLASHIPVTADGMNRYSQRLDHRALFIAHVVWQFEGSVRLGDEVPHWPCP